MPDPAELRPWSRSARASRRTHARLSACRSTAKRSTCSFDRKFERMQAFLEGARRVDHRGRYPLAAPARSRRMTIPCCPVRRLDLGGRAERARGRRLVHHPAVADADRHGRARGQHHLDRRALSGPARHRLHRPFGRQEPARPVVRGAVRHQPRRRGARRADPALDAAERVRQARALAGAVRDRPVRLGQLLPQSPETGRDASAALGGGGRCSSSSPSTAAISAAGSAS